MQRVVRIGADPSAVAQRAKAEGVIHRSGTVAARSSSFIEICAWFAIRRSNLSKSSARASG
jgi:hypothetical protein